MLRARVILTQINMWCVQNQIVSVSVFTGLRKTGPVPLDRRTGNQRDQTHRKEPDWWKSRSEVRRRPLVPPEPGQTAHCPPEGDIQDKDLLSDGDGPKARQRFPAGPEVRSASQNQNRAFTTEPKSCRTDGMRHGQMDRWMSSETKSCRKQKAAGVVSDPVPDTAVRAENSLRVQLDLHLTHTPHTHTQKHTHTSAAVRRRLTLVLVLVPGCGSVRFCPGAVQSGRRRWPPVGPAAASRRPRGGPLQEERMFSHSGPAQRPGAPHRHQGVGHSQPERSRRRGRRGGGGKLGRRRNYKQREESFCPPL